MGNIITATGTKIYIGGAVTEAQADTLAEFEAMSAWTEIGLVENLNAFGDKSNSVTFASLADSRMRKAKGVRDAGDFTIVCAHDPTDAGQAAVDAAEATKNTYAFKVVIPDAPDNTYSDTLQFFRALVMGKRKNIGTADNVMRNEYDVAIDSEVFSDPAST
jgi:hypothetical protein